MAGDGDAAPRDFRLHCAINQRNEAAGEISVRCSNYRNQEIIFAAFEYVIPDADLDSQGTCLAAVLLPTACPGFAITDHEVLL